MRVSHVLKAATAFTVFSVLLATAYPGQATQNINENPVIVKCTKRFNHCLTSCNHKFGTSWRDPGRVPCGSNCADKLFECEQQPG